MTAKATLTELDFLTNEGNLLYLNEYHTTDLGFMICDFVCVDLNSFEKQTILKDAILRGTDIKSTTQIVEMSARRMLVSDTDKGEELKRQVADLKELLYAYRHGFIKEKR